MNTQTFIGIIAICSVFVICEAISKLTKYRIPSYLMVLIAIIILGGQLGIITEAHFENTGFSDLMVTYGLPFALAGFGASIDFHNFKTEWKTCLIATGAVFCIVGLGVLAGLLLGNMQEMLYGAIEVAGGGQAGLIFIAKLKEEQHTEMIVYITMLMSMQLMVGYPLCEIALRRAIEERIKKARLPEIERTEGAKKNAVKGIHVPSFLGEDFYYVFVILSLCGLGSIYIGKMTGISSYVWCLIFGFLMRQFGFLKQNCLDQIGAKGFIYGTMYAAILSDLTTVKITDLLIIMPQILAMLALGVVGCVICGIIFSRLFHISVYEAFAIAISCMVGYPPSLKIVPECMTMVQEKYNINEETKEALMTYYEPKIVISGIVSISTLSGVFAGIVVSFF